MECKLENITVHYESYGQGESAILLIHGWGMSGRTWDHVVPPLVAAGHRVITIDHRGCGKSDMDFDDIGIKAIAGDTTYTNEDRALLAGASATILGSEHAKKMSVE